MLWFVPSQQASLQVLLNTRAKRTEDCAWVTCSGQPLAGDVVYQTVGGTANTRFLKGSGIPTDSRGFIKVQREETRPRPFHDPEADRKPAELRVARFPINIRAELTCAQSPLPQCSLYSLAS